MLALCFCQVIGILHKLVKVESSVLLQLCQYFGLAEDIGQLEHNRPEERYLIDDHIYLFH